MQFWPRRNTFSCKLKMFSFFYYEPRLTVVLVFVLNACFTLICVRVCMGLFDLLYLRFIYVHSNYFVPSNY